MLNTGHGNDTAPRIPLSPSAAAGDDALSSTASPFGHPRLCKAGHKPVPTPGAACAEPPACPPDPVPWLLGEPGGRTRGEPAALCPYLQPGHHAAAAGASQGDPGRLRGCAASPGLRAGRWERKEERKRKEKRPNTSSHRKGSGKGSGKLNRRVQTFFGKAPAGPGCSPRRSAAGPAAPTGQERDRASPAGGRAGSSSRFPPLGRIRRLPQARGQLSRGSPTRTGTDPPMPAAARHLGDSPATPALEQPHGQGMGFAEE